jgi:lipopolysaccharide transport system permease protein
MSEALLSSLFPARHASLIWQLARRELHARFRQSWLGPAWLVLTPMLMLGVYTLVFRHVMRFRWGQLDDSSMGYALQLFAGLAVFNFFADCINRSPQLILEQPHLVKKVIFPLEILPWVNIVSSLVQLGISALLLLALCLLATGTLPPTVAALPLVWLALIPLCLGLGWLLGGLGVYIQDIGQLVGMVVMVFLFLSPVFFPVEALPGEWRQWVNLNPLALVVTQTREVLVHARWPDWPVLALHLAASSCAAVLGALFFNAVKKGFADAM